MRTQPKVNATNPKILLIILDLFYDYADHTKVGGMYYLRKNKTKGILRIFWTIAPILILMFGVFLTYELLTSFLWIPTRFVIDPPIPTSNVFFPALTFCHPQMVLDFKALQFVQKIKLPVGTDADEVLRALPSLGMFVENQWGNRPNTNVLSLIDETLQLNNYTVEKAVQELGLNCSDFVLACAWAKVGFSCFNTNSPIAFTPTKSYMGMCCSFNYQPDNPSFVALQAPTFGTRGGLTIIGTGYPQLADGKSGVIFSSGFMLLIHHPYDYPVEGNEMVLIEVGAITSVAINPILSTIASNIALMPVKTRRCVLDYELEPSIYRQPECAVACTRRFIYEKCKCHPFHMPPPPKVERIMRNCTALDAACFARNYFKIKRARCDYCMPGCTDSKYIYTSFSNPYDLRNTSMNLLSIYRQVNLTGLKFTTHVYMAMQVSKAQQLEIVMSQINLMATIGGCFSLSLGISIVSIIEIMFYMIVRLPKQMKLRRRDFPSNMNVIRRQRQNIMQCRPFD